MYGFTDTDMSEISKTYNINMDTDFFRDTLLSVAGDNYINAVYHDCWGQNISINRERNTEDDRINHIDATVTRHTPQKTIKIQEKICRGRYAKYETLTVEAYQNRHTGEHGELWHCSADIYAHGYWVIDGYLLDTIHLYDWHRLQPWILDHLNEYPIIPVSTSRASFIAIPYNDITDFAYYEG